MLSVRSGGPRRSYNSSQRVHCADRMQTATRSSTGCDGWARSLGCQPGFTGALTCLPLRTFEILLCAPT